MSRTVQQLVAAFENIPTENKCEVVAPTSSLRVKALVKLFEATTIDKEEFEQIKTDKDSKTAEPAVQARVTFNDDTNRKINRNEWAPGRGDDNIQQTLVQKMIAMFENMAYEGLFHAHRSLETAPSTFEEEREDGTTSVTPAVENDVEIKANLDQTAQKENTFISHVNVPSSTPGHSVPSKRSQVKKLWNKLSWPRVLVKFARRLSISKRNCSKTEDIGIVSDPIQTASTTVDPTSVDLLVGKKENMLLETAPSTLEEEGEDGTTSVNPTISDSTAETEVEIEENLNQTPQKESPYTFQVNVPAFTPGLSIRSKMGQVKTLWSNLFRPSVSMNIVRGLKIFKTNSNTTQDIGILTVPVRIASTTVITKSEDFIAEKKDDTLLETAPSIFEEECQDGATSVNPTTPDCTAESDIEANLDQTAQKENASTVPRNIPSSTTDHSIRPKVGQPRNSTKSQNLRILTAPVQIASGTIIPLSTGSSAEENDNVSSETAPSKLKEECQNGATSVNPTTSDSTTTESGEIETEANLSHTAQSENPSTFHQTVPSSTSDDAIRSKMGQAKSLRSKLSTPRFVMNTAKGLGISKRNSRQTKDIRPSIIPAQVSIPIPSSGAGEFKNIEITISVTSVSFK